MGVLSSNRPDTLNLSINYGFSNLPIHDCEAVLKAPVSRGTGWVTITYFMTKLRAFTGTQIWPSSSPLHNVSSCDKLPWLALDRHLDTYPNATDYMPCHVGRLHGKRVLVSTQHPSPSPYKGHIIWSALLSSIHKSQNHTQPKLSFHFHFLVSISLSKVSFISPFRPPAKQSPEKLKLFPGEMEVSATDRCLDCQSENVTFSCRRVFW